MRLNWFPTVAFGVLSLFLGIIIFVVFIAFTRRSGQTGLDMGKVQQMHYEAVFKNKSGSI